ncbi:MAG: type II toxin-antitoxin system antitoxin, RelB/DinJ family [Oscillospiraceae bacterium]|nr:type II toxin-antitoxin system antitoxin, RelB/DinJ family [Oscillospiraceae bacterium]
MRSKRGDNVDKKETKEIAESEMTIEELARIKGVPPTPPHLDASKWTKEQLDAEIEKGMKDIREGRVTPLEDFVEELKREGRL